MKKIILFTIVYLAISKLSIADSNLDIFFKNSSDYDNVLVTEVRSAEHFVIYNAHNKKEIIKLIGLNAPEPPRIREVDVERDRHGFRVETESSPITSIEEEAYTFVKELIENKKVRLEFDSNKKNDSSQTLAYVFLIEEDVFVNVEILRQGFANLQIRPPNTKYKSKLRKAYQEARREKRGLQGQ